MKGVTQEPKKIEFPNFYLIDTPGLNDTRIPMADWACRYNETTEMSAQETIHLALIIFKCKERPDLADFNIMGALKEALDHICPQNVALVFTFAD